MQGEGIPNEVPGRSLVVRGMLHWELEITSGKNRA